MRTFRFWLTFAGSAIALASVLLIVGVWLEHWRLGLPASSDEVTRINTIVAASAYGAAILAVVFALVAYWQASGRPSLKPELQFTNHDPGDFSLPAIPNREPPSWVNTDNAPFSGWYFDLRHAKERQSDDVIIIDTGGPELLANITLANTTKYAARNPGVRVEFHGLLYQSPSPGWAVAERWPSWNGMKSIQWDGGTDNIVHGLWSRKLPALNFNEIVLTRLEPPVLIVTVVADGCAPQEFRMPLDVTVSHEP